MGSKRPPIEGEPVEVIAPNKGLASNGWRELRLYDEGFELEEKRPKKVHVVRWNEIEEMKVGRARTSNGVLIKLREGVALSRMERFERIFGGKDLVVPPVFLSSHEELLDKLMSFAGRDC